MKITKHIALLLSILILVSNVGLAFNVHYCGGNIASISFDYKKSEVCIEEKKVAEKACCAEQNTSDDCCKNSKIEIKKSTTDNLIVKSMQLNLSSFTISDSWQNVISPVSDGIVVTKKTYFHFCGSNAPPFYKLYSQLIFYA